MLRRLRNRSYRCNDVVMLVFLLFFLTTRYGVHEQNNSGLN